jgi:hypothetical protein
MIKAMPFCDLHEKFVEAGGVIAGVLKRSTETGS